MYRTLKLEWSNVVILQMQKTIVSWLILILMLLLTEYIFDEEQISSGIKFIFSEPNNIFVS